MKAKRTKFTNFDSLKRWLIYSVCAIKTQQNNDAHRSTSICQILEFAESLR